MNFDASDILKKIPSLTPDECKAIVECKEHMERHRVLLASERELLKIISKMTDSTDGSVYDDDTNTVSKYVGNLIKGLKKNIEEQIYCLHKIKEVNKYPIFKGYSSSLGEDCFDKLISVTESEYKEFPSDDAIESCSEGFLKLFGSMEKNMSSLTDDKNGPIEEQQQGMNF